MLRIKEATCKVKEYWVSLYGDEGFYSDEVYSAITLTHKKDPTKATYATLQKHLTPEGYTVALEIIDEYTRKRVKLTSRFQSGGICSKRLLS